MTITLTGRAALALAVTAALTGCRATGPGSLDVHEAVLSGSAQEHVVWVYGGPDAARTSITIGGHRATLGDSATPGEVPGTLMVDGRATYRTPSQPAKVAFRAGPVIGGRVQILTSDPAVIAAYVTDGERWMRLSGTTGTVTAAPSTALRGAGNLTDAEADAVGAALLHQGSLSVAVLAEGSIPDAPLTLEPAPRAYLRTGLYVAPPARPVSSATTPSPTTPGDRVTYTELGSGTNAAVTAATVQVATTPEQVATLYAQAYGRQTPAPTPVSAGTGTIVGVFLGQKPTGGNSVHVTRATAGNGVLTVTVQVRSPGPGSITTQALTSPWVLVRVDGTYREVRVVDQLGRPLPTGTGTDR